MSTDAKTEQSLRAESAELRARLEEAEETLRAIRGGEVDALVVGEQIYMLESADAASNRFRGEVLAQINDVVIAVDNDNRVTYLNPAAERQYGFDASEVLGCGLDEVLHYRWLRPDDEIAAQTALRETGVWRGGNIHVKRNGEEIQVESAVSVLRDGGGAVVGQLAVIRDITERKRAEEALRESEERLRLTTESVTDYAILTTDTEGRITSWNVGAECIFGYTEEEITGRPSEIIFTPEDRAQGIPEAEMRLAREVGRAEDERWHISKHGVRFYVSGIMSPLRANGVLTGYAKIARDLTDRKRMEEELRRAREELERRVAERTRELAEANKALRVENAGRRRIERARLQLLRQLVRVQDDERRRIARDIHDHLGQQSTALRLKLEALKEQCARYAELCGLIEQTQAIAARLDADVDFLAWELRPAALDDLGLAAALANFVKEWSKHFSIPAQFHSTGMDKDRPAPEVEINLYRIAQEALNNTCKHAQASRVDVLLERHDGSVVLIVEDDGVGFDPQAKERADRRLGLLGMRERAGLVGGTLEIESAPNQGTTIFARVPVSLPEEGVAEG